MGTDWGCFARHFLYTRRPGGRYDLLLLDADCDRKRCSGAVDGFGVSCCAREWLRCSYPYAYGYSDACEHGYCHRHLYANAEARRCVSSGSHSYTYCHPDCHVYCHGHSDIELA